MRAPPPRENRAAGRSVRVGENGWRAAVIAEDAGEAGQRHPSRCLTITKY